MDTKNNGTSGEVLPLTPSIQMQDFLVRQPAFTGEPATADFYLDIARRLAVCLTQCELSEGLNPSVIKRTALNLTDYLQDIVADGGLWRSFVDANRKMHGRTVPFYNVSSGYVDYELNIEDVRFLVWYSIAMLSEEHRDLYPLDKGLMRMADEAFALLEGVYDDAPLPEDWRLTLGLDLKDPEDKDRIYSLGHWLFLSSYLLTPAFALDLMEIVSDPAMTKEDGSEYLQRRLESAMMENPTGPLALYDTEWLFLLFEGKFPDMKHRDGEKESDPHPYYSAFVKATGGKRIAYFSSYEHMNRFFIDGMGWEAGKEHLQMAKGASDYILLVNPEKGMLMARGIARCVSDPDNPLYDSGYAREHAFELLTMRGLCPGDLLQFIFEHDWLPDAVFPGTDDKTTVAENRDFIARCYLQQYYRGD